MTRLTPWILLLSVWAIAWPNLASSPPNLENTLQAQNERVSENPRDPLAWNDLGNLLVLAGRSDEAEQAYRQALALAPGETVARFNLALLLHQVGRTGDASREFEQLLEIDPYHAWGHYQLGVIHAERKDRKEALDHYSRAFAYDPALTFAENNAHIIDNPLFGEALLMSQRHLDSPTSRVPRQYGEPSRILDMMLEEEMAAEDGGEDAKGDESDESEDDDDGTSAGGSMASAGGAAARFESDQPGRAPSQGTTNRPPTARSREGVPTQTLTTVGQPPAGRGAAATEREASAQRGTPPRRSVPRTPTTTLRRTPPPTSASSEESGATPPPPTLRRTPPPPTLRRTPPPPTRSSRYIPSSRRSTSQLDLRLLPEEEPPSRYAALEGRQGPSSSPRGIEGGQH